MSLFYTVSCLYGVTEILRWRYCFEHCLIYALSVGCNDVFLCYIRHTILLARGHLHSCLLFDAYVQLWSHSQRLTAWECNKPSLSNVLCLVRNLILCVRSNQTVVLCLPSLIAVFLTAGNVVPAFPLQLCISQLVISSQLTILILN